MPSLLTAAVMAATLAGPQVVRHPNAAGSATSRAVEVVLPAAMIFVSGQTPLPADIHAVADTRAYWGDTEAQARTVFVKLARVLNGLGVGMNDIVKMQVFLVGDPANGGRADTSGFGRAYEAAFDITGATHLPARTVVTVASLARPGMLVEVDVVVVRSSSKAQ